MTFTIVPSFRNNWTRSCFLLAAALLAAVLAGRADAAPPGLPRAAPEDVQMDGGTLDEIDRVVEQGIARGNLPGCVVLVGRQGKIVFWRAYGHRQLQPSPLPMTPDTLFDLASLTKPIATATSVMRLIQSGQLTLDDRVATHLPDFGQAGKDKITVRQLLTHQSGLLADNSLADYAQGRDAAWQRINALGLRAEPGTEFIYSDVGYIVLGELIARLSGQDLHEFSRQAIFQPLGMSDTGFLPDSERASRAATTEQRDGRWMRGQVHDPRAHRLGGVAGHAGLFSTAADLARYAQMLLDGGRYAGVRVLDEATVELMRRPVPVPGGLRGLGWDIQTGYSSNRGDLFSAQAFGHGGFTGTSLWIDPQLKMFVVFLSNRVHPDGKGLVNPLAGRIGTIAAAAVGRKPVAGE
ncbi:MAG: serine hydrolase [Pirellulaceae bacterium]|nr:serine hydrolase [Pirellulaceae bacterium]